MIFALGLAAQLAIVSHAPDTAATCDPVEVTVAVRVPGTTVPQLVPPAFTPFDVLRSSPAPQVTIESGARPSLLAEYRFVVATDRVGTFILPPFEARFGGQVARSDPLSIVVRQGSARVPLVVARARVDTSLAVNFRALTQPETVYVGQQANYEVAVFLNENVRERLRRNPTFFPPDIQSMLAYDLPSSGNPPRRQVGSRCFDALVYQRALFPLLPGRFVIPPAQLVYSLPVSSSFFSREESRELQTDSAVIVAIAPPAAGRPADYAGAVGSLRLSAHLDTTLGRVGSPMTLTVRVAGTGNVRLFPRPDVRVPWGSLVKGDERVLVDSGNPRITGRKEFDWVLTPTRPGELDLPPVTYPYFDPGDPPLRAGDHRSATHPGGPRHARVGGHRAHRSRAHPPDDLARAHGAATQRPAGVLAPAGHCAAARPWTARAPPPPRARAADALIPAPRTARGSGGRHGTRRAGSAATLRPVPCR